MDINPLYFMFPVTLTSNMLYILPASGVGVPMTLAAGARWISVKDTVGDINVYVTDKMVTYVPKDSS